MYWECSACGHHVVQLEMPDVCESCGITGAIFNPLTPRGSSELAPEQLRDHWMQIGLDWADEEVRNLAAEDPDSN